MLRSATLIIGIVLALVAFVGFLMLGGMMAPPPFAVVVAVQDIPAYSTLDPNALGVDSQRINSQVARTLILRDEIDQYAGGFVVENIHAGEPLRKGAIVAPDNPQAATRLALMLTDPDRVAMVIPVDAKTAPSQMAPGDWVDLVLGLAPGNISAGSGTTFSSLLSPTPAAISFPLGPSYPVTAGVRSTPQPAVPQTSLPSFPFGTPITTTGSVSAGEMNLPADKVVIQNVPVLGVRFQQVPNPAFTGSGGSLGQTSGASSAPQPAYIAGDIQAATVLLPRASVELVTFAMDNGRVHMALLPVKTGQAANGAQSPTFGISFNDVLAWMMRERALSSGQLQPAPNQPAPTQAVPGVSSTPAGVPGEPTAASPVSPTQPAPAQARPTAAPTSTSATISTGLDMTALLGPLSCGVVLLILFVAVVRFIRTRRRDSGIA